MATRTTKTTKTVKGVKHPVRLLACVQTTTRLNVVSRQICHWRILRTANCLQRCADVDIRVSYGM